MSEAIAILQGSAEGALLVSHEPLSFWGGVDPATGRIIDVHHALHGESLTGRILMLPSTRGSCTGSGVLLDMVLNGKGPAALLFSQEEDVATLGALIGGALFGRPLPVLRLSAGAWAALASEQSARIRDESLEAGAMRLPLDPPPSGGVTLSAADEAFLSGAHGEAAQLAMQMIVTMAANQGARRLIDVSQAHIDGCIYASPANLTFAEKMADMGAKVRVPTTMNAISVDRENWQDQGVPQLFGGPAARLADAYVRMGCQNSFTCSPYLLDSAPREGEAIAWAESNAVIYANSALGARTAKHPDFLDLCIAMTGRAPESGVYLSENRIAKRVLQIELPPEFDDAFWPLIGYLAGKASPDRIPLLCGLETAGVGPEALKALCAAFGTTSAAPMLHIAGVTPEAGAPAADADVMTITRADMAAGWQLLNAGPERVELIAIGSPHASLAECEAFARAMAGEKVRIATIITAGRKVISDARDNGTLAALEAAGVQVLPDLCWCSISEPVFPPDTKALMTNSGKYAHYGPGLSGRQIRFDGLAACARAAKTGIAPKTLPAWLG